MRLEDALIKKSRPKFNSKRFWLLQKAAGYPLSKPCEICGRMLLNPQSIIIHQGGVCQSKLSNQQNKNKMEDLTQATEPPSQPEEMTFGMKLVGINFNPSGDAKVNKAKELCAQLADLVTDDFHANGGAPTSFLKSALYTNTIGEILNAQMNVVKLLTLKY